MLPAKAQQLPRNPPGKVSEYERPDSDHTTPAHAAQFIPRTSSTTTTGASVCPPVRGYGASRGERRMDALVQPQNQESRGRERTLHGRRSLRSTPGRSWPNTDTSRSAKAALATAPSLCGASIFIKSKGVSISSTSRRKRPNLGGAEGAQQGAKNVRNRGAHDRPEPP